MSKPSKLLISGIRIDNSRRICESFSALPPFTFTLEVAKISQVAELGGKYDQVVINAHGTYEGESDLAKITDRRHHLVLDDVGRIVDTAPLLKKCAEYSNKILVDSCFAGVLAKDLDPEELRGTEIVFAGGSKHTTLLNPGILAVEKRFLFDGLNGLLDFAKTNHPGSLVVKDAEGNFTKISSVKVDEDNRIRRDFSILNHEKKWERDEGIFLDPGQLGQGFKDLAFAFAVKKNKMKDVQYWLENGADVSAKIFGDGLSLFFSAAVDGDLELLKRLWEIPEVKKDEIEKMTLVAALKKDRATCGFLLSKLNEDQLRNLDLREESVGLELSTLMICAARIDGEMARNLIGKMRASQLQNSFNEIVSAEEHELSGSLIPMIDERFDELVKESGIYAEKEVIKKHKKSFGEDVKRCEKNGWNIPREYRRPSACVVS